jgi:uncharacterized protein (UPF0276 family)
MFDEAYAQNLIDVAMRLNSPWISEHLSFTRVGTGHEVNSAIPLPVPYDHEILDLLEPRARFFTSRLKCRFLLETTSITSAIQARISRRSSSSTNSVAGRGCGVLLDLHNLYANSVNHGFPAGDYFA